MRALRFVLGCAVLTALACGGGSPTGPTVAPTPQPTPQTLVVTSGDTGAPVAGARVIVNGQEFTSDGNGQITVPGGLPGSTLVDVLAPGFLDRQTLLSRVAGGGRYSVWPRTTEAGMTEQFTLEEVYSSLTLENMNPPLGDRVLARWPSAATRVEVLLQGPATDPAFREFSPGALAVQSEAVAAINASTGGRFTLAEPVFGDGADGSNRILVRIHPELAACVEGYAGYASVMGIPIRAAVVTFCEPRWASHVGIAIHELGHAFGLRHSSDEGDVMFPQAHWRRRLDLSPRERQLMGLMLQRPAGNRFPDDDRSALATSAVSVEFRCP